MGAPAYFKLGLFTLACIASLVIAIIVLGAYSGRRPTVTYHTSFDETVQGLDVGAPIKYRGVRIGSVTAIAVAADHRHVDVAYAVDASQASALSLSTAATALRASLSSQGITGIRFIDIDVSDPGERVEGTLAPGYLASRRSLTDQLEDNLGDVGHDLPRLVAEARATLRDFDVVLRDVHDQALVARVGSAADEARELLASVRTLKPRVDDTLVKWGQLADHADTAVDAVSARLSSVDALIVSARRAASMFGTLGEHTLDSSDDVLRELGEAARGVRDLATELTRNPDMLLKGRAAPRRP